MATATTSPSRKSTILKKRSKSIVSIWRKKQLNMDQVWETKTVSHKRMNLRILEEITTSEINLSTINQDIQAVTTTKTAHDIHPRIVIQEKIHNSGRSRIIQRTGITTCTAATIDNLNSTKAIHTNLDHHSSQDVMR